MAEGILSHLAYIILFGMSAGAGGVCLLAGRLGLSSVFWILCLVIANFWHRDRKALQVKDTRSARKAVNKSGYGVLEQGQEAMRAHLKTHPDDYKVALTLARNLSKYHLDPEGRTAYALAAKGAMHRDQKLAVEIFREYFAKYTKPFKPRLTYELALLAEQYGDGHFATQGLEAVFNTPDVDTDMARMSLRECIRICKELGLNDAARAYSERLKTLNQPRCL